MIGIYSKAFLTLLIGMYAPHFLRAGYLIIMKRTAVCRMRNTCKDSRIKQNFKIWYILIIPNFSINVIEYMCFICISSPKLNF